MREALGRTELPSVHRCRARRGALALAVLAALCALGAAPCLAFDPVDALRLESHSPVVTWEENGSRVFVADQGALIRQGESRLFAPLMVVWFDRARSERPDVNMAIVRVYVEGVAAKSGEIALPVSIVDGGKVERRAAAYLELSSQLAFVWDCPLERSETRRPSRLLLKAEQVASGATGATYWDTLPQAREPDPFELVTRTLRADQVHVFWEEMTVVYAGDVRGSFGNMSMRADEAVLWYDQKSGIYEIYARGKVRVSPVPEAETPTAHEVGQRAADVLGVLRFASADELYINPGQGRGMASNPELRVKNPDAPEDVVYVLRGNEAYLVNSQTLAISEVSITTCQFARPHYQFRAPRAQIVRQPPSTFLTAWEPEVEVGESRRRLLWLPFLGTELSQGTYLLADYAFGFAGKFGAFLQTTWRPLDLTTPPDWVEDWLVMLDYYGARGPGIGTEFTWKTGPAYPHYEGTLQAYYVSDGGTEDDTGLPVPQTSRGRLHLEQRLQVDRDWRVDSEVYWLSDPGFLNEYFEGEFENEKTPETYLLGRYLRNSTYLALLAKVQLNSFLTDVEELPSADLEVMGRPVGPFVYDGSVRAGLYDQQMSDLIVPAPPDPPSVARFHTDQMLALPMNVGILRVNPYVRALGTWADEGAAFTGSQSRVGFGGGASVSTTFSRVYPTVSDLFDLNRLRHIITPYVAVDFLSVSGNGSASFIQMDDVDAIDTATQVQLGLRHRLQTKRLSQGEWRTVDWIDLDTALVLRSSDSVDTLQGEDYLRADLDVLLTDHVRLHSHDDRIGLENLPTVVNVGFMLDWLPKWSLMLDYDWIEKSSSTITAELFYELSERYMLLLYEQYALSEAGTGSSQSQQTRVTIRRLLDQWVLDLGVSQDRTTGDVALMIGFGPKGWGVFQNVRRGSR